MLHKLTLFLAFTVVGTLYAQSGAIQSAEGLDNIHFGAELRFRTETYNPIRPIDGLDSDSTSAGRARLYFSAEVEDHLSAFLEFQGAAVDSGSESDSSLHQGWGRLNHLGGSASLQFGRFEMDYGNGRMVSSFDWSATGRAWDGLRWHSKLDNLLVDAFWTRPVAGQGAPLGGRDSFGGLYASLIDSPLGMDIYAFSRNQDSTTLNRARDFTYGAIFSGSPGPGMSWSLEGAYQTGDHGASEASAHAMAFRFDIESGPEVSFGFGYELASGDNDSLDGNAKEFLPLYDSGDVWHGTMDLFSWTNLQDFVLRARVGFDDAWAFHTELHQFSLAKDGGDNPFHDSAVVLSADGDLGTELDLFVTGALNDFAHLRVGVSEFFAGDAIINGDNQMWSFAQIELRF
ncbi:MAG: alginate export family protein [Planctomycetes bacterium]|jgi:hypothetical protein|nr:alginate export family protein [Planctomycetota bacterium]MBT4028778.1 alginate export family protein [Planctomycetota bacterium]MBT4559662.1 alginate export family protein [Planctomycetota bacterium]MBT5100483.1 alginate export family protein [Planctomycetota bacterium]